MTKKIDMTQYFINNLIKHTYVSPVGRKPFNVAKIKTDPEARYRLFILMSELEEGKITLNYNKISRVLNQKKFLRQPCKFIKDGVEAYGFYNGYSHAGRKCEWVVHNDISRSVDDIIEFLDWDTKYDKERNSKQTS